MENFTPAEQWAGAFGVNTFEEYKLKFCPEFYLNPLIPEDTLQRLRSIEKLLQHAYYEYVFFDFARELILLTLEKELGNFYEKTTGKERSKSDSLDTYLNWVRKNGYSEITNTFFYKHLREGRNGVAHPRNFGLAGPVVSHWIYSVIDFLNDLYEDQDLRLLRRKMEAPIKKWIKKNKYRGFILKTSQIEHIIWDLEIIFINNKSNPTRYTMAFTPIFDLAPYKENKWLTPEVFFMNFEDIEVLEENVKLIHSSKGELYIKPINEKDGSIAFEEWLKEFNTLPEVSMISHLHLRKYDGIFKKLRREFHRQS